MAASSDYHYAGEVWNQTRDYGAVLKYLARKGVSKLDSIKAFHEFCEVSLKEAKRIVTESDEWASTRGDAQRLHDSILDGLADEEV